MRQTGSPIETVRQTVHSEEQLKKNIAYEDKNWFSKIVRQQTTIIRRHRNESKKRESLFTMKEIAARVGINPDCLKKIINKSRPTKSRDCIIAICAAIGLGPYETNDVLYWYDDFPCLDSNNRRDNLIAAMLKASKENYGLQSELFSRVLKKYGFSPLKVKEHRNTKKSKYYDTNDETYELSSPRAWTDILSTIYGGTPSNSLEDQFDPSRYECFAAVEAKRKKDGRLFFLRASSRGKFDVWDENDRVFPILSTSELFETRDFQDVFISLQSMVSKELDSVLTCCNETKNYHKRTSARFVDGAIYFFSEKYNYDIPERNEYYLMEYVNGEYSLSCSSRSRFMESYLPENEFEEHFGTKKEVVPGRRYHSLAEINGYMDSVRKYSEEYEILWSRRRAFEELAKEITDLHEALQTRHEFIRDLENIYEYPDRVCLYYKVEKEYDLWIDPLFGDACFANNKSVDFDFGKGVVKISIEELHRAFELGIDTIEEVYKVIVEKGSIDSLLQNS